MVQNYFEKSTAYRHESVDTTSDGSKFTKATRKWIPDVETMQIQKDEAGNRYSNKQKAEQVFKYCLETNEPKRTEITKLNKLQENYEGNRDNEMRPLEKSCKGGKGKYTGMTKLWKYNKNIRGLWKISVNNMNSELQELGKGYTYKEMGVEVTYAGALVKWRKTISLKKVVVKMRRAVKCLLESFPTQVVSSN